MISIKCRALHLTSFRSGVCGNGIDLPSLLPDSHLHGFEQKPGDPVVCEQLPTEEGEGQRKSSGDAKSRSRPDLSLDVTPPRNTSLMAAVTLCNGPPRVEEVPGGQGLCDSRPPVPSTVPGARQGGYIDDPKNEEGEPRPGNRCKWCPRASPPLSCALTAGSRPTPPSAGTHWL